MNDEWIQMPIPASRYDEFLRWVNSAPAPTCGKSLRDKRSSDVPARHCSKAPGHSDRHHYR